MNAFSRKITTIQTGDKAITLNHSKTEITDSLDIEIMATRRSKFAVNENLETVSTSYSDRTTKSGLNSNTSPMHKDMEVDRELSTGFSIDSTMKVQKDSVQSKVVSEYGRDIINNMKKKEMTMVGNLEIHEIKGSHRKQMVVWMEEVLKIFKCPLETFFLSVHILDRYLETSAVSLKLADLHEVGIVSMFIASKYQEVEPLTLDLMVEKISHGKITREDIIRTEKKIMCTLKFKLSVPHVLNFIDSYMELFSCNFESDSKLEVKEMAIAIAKNGISDRRIAFNILPSELALCSIIIAIKNFSKSVGKTILTSEFSKAIKSELTSDESLVLQFGKKLKKLSIEQIY
jgi:hypothetical protein